MQAAYDVAENARRIVVVAVAGEGAERAAAFGALEQNGIVVSGMEPRGAVSVTTTAARLRVFRQLASALRHRAARATSERHG